MKIKIAILLVLLALLPVARVQAVVGTLDISGTVATASANIHGQIFYDSNNLNYFLDPAAASQSLLLAGKASIGTTANTQTLNLNGGIGFSNGPAIKDAAGKLQFQVGGTGDGPTDPGSIYFLDSQGTTRARFNASTSNNTTNLGTGTDGACSISQNTNLNTDSCVGRQAADAIAYSITSYVLRGDKTISMADTTGLAVGDEVLIIDLQGTAANNGNVGKFETRTISAMTSNVSITFSTRLQNDYDGTTQKIMVQRIPQYTDVTVITSDSYGGSSTLPGKSCSSLLLDGVVADGVYWIDPDGPGGTAPFQVYCDMTTNGGGWTLVANIAPADGNSVGYNNQAFWTTQAEYQSFANKFANDYKSPAAYTLNGDKLMIESTNTGADGSILGWRSWPMSYRSFGSLFTTGLPAVHATDYCETATADAVSVGTTSTWDDIIRRGTCVYTDANPSASGEGDVMRLTTIPYNSTDNDMAGFASCIDCGTTWQGATYPWMGIDRAGCNAAACTYAAICRMPSADCRGNYCSGTYSATSCGSTWNSRFYIKDTTAVADTLILTANAWDGTKYGVLMLRATGTVTNNGTIHMNGKGYQPGATNTIGSSAGGYQGEGTSGAGVNTASAARRAANGTAGGTPWDTSTYGYAEGGGGGGYGTAGSSGTTSHSSYTTSVGVGGAAYGNAALTALFLGSAGGAGGAGYTPWGLSNGTTDGKGGAGGGIVYLTAATLTNNGTISANGNTGYNGFGYTTSCTAAICGGGGGSGSGGSLFIGANSVTTGTMTASGGAQTNGGGGSYGNGWNASTGGAGGNGRIRIQYATTLSGTTTPDASAALTSSIYGTMYTGVTNTSSSDVAEHYASREKLMAGDVVALDPNNPFYIKKATQADQKLLGIISTDPGVILGQGDLPAGKDPTYPVALTGRVPVRVDPSSPAIRTGDFLTVSQKTTGLAMKATQQGFVVARALENWNPGDKTTIQAFANLSYHIGEITKAGTLQITGSISGTDLVRGSAAIEPGEKQITIKRTWTNKPKVINATPSYNTDVGVTRITEDGFTLEVNRPPTKQEQIYWQAWW